MTDAKDHKDKDKDKDDRKPGLSYRARRRWSLLILVVGMPAYAVAAVTLMNAIPRPPVAIEFLLYVILGIAWVLPFRFVFRGVGQADPDAPEEDGRD